MNADTREHTLTQPPKAGLLELGRTVYYRQDDVYGTIIGYSRSGASYRVQWEDGHTDGAEPYGSFVDANAVEPV